MPNRVYAEGLGSQSPLPLVPKEGFQIRVPKVSPPTELSQGIVPPPTQAGLPVADVGKGIWDYLRIIFDTFKARLETAMNIAWKQAMRGFVQRGAYTLATKLAAGARGQKPLIVRQWNFNDEIDAAFGDFLNNSVGKAWGRDLCETKDPLLKINIEIAARQIVSPFVPGSPISKPRCSFKKIIDNFGDLGKVPAVDVPKLANMFNPESNDIGAVLTLTSGALTAGQQAEKDARTRALAEGSIKSILDPVTGEVRVPAGYVAEQFFKNVVDLPSVVDFLHSDDPYANAVDLFVKTFVNTFASRLMTKIFSEGFTISQGPADFGASGGIEAARLKFRELLRVEFRSGGKTDIVAELESCENSSSTQAVANNCVIDRGFADAILDQKTVGEALSEGQLHGNWAVGQLERGQGKTSDLSEIPSGLYSLRSIQILRKYGIVPVGWEIAAKYITEVEESDLPSTRWTLETISSKDHFNNPQSPFYHLVDRSWVLKSPEVLAKRRGPGERISHFQPVAETVGGEIVTRELPVRLDYNADEQTCIFEDNEGNCKQYGYCTEYRNTWKINPGKSCDAGDVSCQAFVKSDGSVVSYLQNTISKGTAPNECSASNAGCRWYCTDYDEAAGDFTCTGNLDPGKTVHLNNRGIESDNVCSEEEAGCSGFLRLTDFSTGESLPEADVQSRINDEIAKGDTGDYTEISDIKVTQVPFRIAPAYLNCDDPLNASASCGDYAVRCTADEVECKLYTPVTDSNDLPVSAIIDPAADTCPAECAGLNTFYEQPTFFDNVSSFPKQMDLIPDNQQSCQASFSGCEEFTNLSVPAGGGENREYYFEIQSCVQDGAAGATINTYYSWQGSDDTGFQLRVWRLMKSNQDNAPCTNGRGSGSGTGCYDNSNDPLTGEFLSTKKCGPETPSDPNDDPNINPDCVQFIDEGFNTYWRLRSQTVEATDKCVSMRRQVDGSIWNAVPGKGRQCPASAAGCREYKGSDSFGYRLIPLGDSSGRENFSDGDAEGWHDSTATGRPFEKSEDSPLPDGSSAIVLSAAYSWIADLGSTCSNAEGCPAVNDDGLQCTVEDGQQKCGLISREMKEGERYTIHFWAKNTTDQNTDATIKIKSSSGTGADIVFDTSGVPIINDSIWRPYSFGPILFSRPPAADDQLFFDLYRASPVGNVYVTNIELRETGSIYLIKEDPWNIPNTCKPTVDSLGCSEYTDSSGNPWYIKKFSNICRAEAVGCSLFVDTHNSSLAKGDTFKNGYTVLDDNIEYWVDDDSKYCPSDAIGCTLLGQANRSRDGELLFLPSYIELNADNFDRTMCLSDELYCAEYRFAEDKNRTTYFKDPSDRVCVRKEGSFNYCSGSGLACQIDDDCAVGESCSRFFGEVLAKENSEDLCEIEGVTKFIPAYCNEAGADSSTCYVKGCDKKDSTCTALKDPQDPPNCNIDCPLEFNDLGQPIRTKNDGSGTCNECSGPGCNPGCQTYYRLRNSVEEGECATIGINPAEGCVPFYDEVADEIHGDAPNIVSECQPGCEFGDGSPKNEDCQPLSVGEGGKPGCKGLVPK